MVDQDPLLSDFTRTQQGGDITPDRVARAYSGLPGCMCGCKGAYYEGEAGQRMIRRVIRLLAQCPTARVQDGNIVYGDVGRRHYALYLAR
jgi:hypothetical protein